MLCQFTDEEQSVIPVYREKQKTRNTGILHKIIIPIISILKVFNIHIPLETLGWPDGALCRPGDRTYGEGTHPLRGEGEGTTRLQILIPSTQVGRREARIKKIWLF